MRRNDYDYDIDNEVETNEDENLGVWMAIKIGALVVLSLFLVISAFMSFYTISEQEQAVVTTFGKPETVAERGLHFKIPYIQKVEKVDTQVVGYEMGYYIEGGSDGFFGDESEQRTVSVPEESLMITGDYNFISVDFYGEYKVSDPIKYLYASEYPEMVLRNVTQHCIRTVIGSYKVDDVLTTGKSEIQSKIKDLIIEKMNDLDVGLQLTNITIQDAEPPTAEIISAFKAVESAKQSKETALNNANKYSSEKIPAAKAEVDKIIQNAEAQKQSRINEAEGQTARFEAMYNEYVKYPLITKQRMFYETMEDILPNLKIVIEGSGETQQMLPLEKFAEETVVAEKETENE